MKCRFIWYKFKYGEKAIWNISWLLALNDILQFSKDEYKIDNLK